MNHADRPNTDGWRRTRSATATRPDPPSRPVPRFGPTLEVAARVGIPLGSHRTCCRAGPSACRWPGARTSSLARPGWRAVEAGSAVWMMPSDPVTDRHHRGDERDGQQREPGHLGDDERRAERRSGHPDAEGHHQARHEQRLVDAGRTGVDELPGDGTHEEERDDEATLPARRQRHRRAGQLGQQRHDQHRDGERVVEELSELVLAEGQGVGRPEAEQSERHAAGHVAGRAGQQRRTRVPAASRSTRRPPSPGRRGCRGRPRAAGATGAARRREGTPTPGRCSAR